MKINFLIVLILILSIFLRFWHLNEFPATLYGDEQAFAWNAYNILLTGKDEYGKPFPLEFRSFDDYKAPIPVYILVPFFKVMGMNMFSIRLPVAISSVITVYAVYLLSGLFFRKKASLIITFLMAISPWHIHLSRGYFEATMSLLFFILGIYFYFASKNRLKIMFFGIFFFALSLYTYFTPRILVPIFLLFLFIYSYKYRDRLVTAKEMLKKFTVSFIFFIILISPLIKVTFFGEGLSRFNKLTGSLELEAVQTVVKERNTSNLSARWKPLFHNRYLATVRLVADNYLELLSPNFWYIYGDSSLRYFTGNMGMFYLLEFPFFIVGAYLLFVKKRKVALFFFVWILLAPIPAALVGKPYAVRTLAILPAPFIFVGYGIYKSFDMVKYMFGRRILTVSLVLLFTLSLFTLLIRYYMEYPVYAATWWGWENKAAIDYAIARSTKYKDIFISNFYSGATLAFAVYNHYDPIQYRYAINHPVTMADGRHLVKLGKYYFGSLDLNKNRLEEKIIPTDSLYIGRPEEPRGEDQIVAPDDGRLIFVVHDTLRKKCYIYAKIPC
ncbi:MAG: glycosyltransferase family 39 protein [Patescibacteria group bacterium]|nr:glycosyltransferase family 39 protein [Patescibacteria group bacterium]